MAITQVSNSLVKQDLTISGGSVDNTVIGSGTPAAGTFTTIAGTLASTVTGTTAAASDNSTKIATTAYVTTALANLVDSAPGTLNTLNELAAALGDDASFSTTVTNSIAAKLPLAGGTLTGNVFSGNKTGLTDTNTGHAIAPGGLVYHTTDGTITQSLNRLTDDGPVLRLVGNNTTAGSVGVLSGGLSFGSGSSMTTRMVINSSGNVGINQPSPAAKLDIKGDTTTYGGMAKIYLTDTASNSESRNWAIGNGGSGFGHFTIGRSVSKNGDPMATGTHTVPFMIDHQDNVGIGMAPVPAVGAPLQIQSSTGYVGLRLNGTGSYAHVWDLYASKNGNNDKMFGVYDRNNNAYRLAVIDDGKVGIGTSSPGQTLAVLNGFNYNPPGLGNSLGQFFFGKQDGSGAGSYGLLGGTQGTGNSWLQAQRIDGTATAYDIILQPSGGNVGIGTDPVAKLAIKGANDTNFEVQPDISSGINRITNFNRVNSTYKKLRVDASEHQTYISGNPKTVISTYGLAFNTSSPTANNSIHAYQDATSWTPRLFKGTTEVTSPTVRYGYYMQIGDLVWVSFYFYKSSGTNTASGNWRIYGLPFNITPLTNGAYQRIPAGYVTFNNTNVYNASPHGWQGNSTTYFELYGAQATTNWTGPTAIEMAGTGVINTYP